jgi:hypothetical protein
MNVAITMNLKFQQDITNYAIPNNIVDDEISGYSNVEVV